MYNWINILNNLYANNPYTDNGRVVVTYSGELNVIIVKVLGNYKIVEIDTFTDWGMLNEVCKVVREMYEESY